MSRALREKCVVTISIAFPPGPTDCLAEGYTIIKLPVNVCNGALL